ncbi:hypothetical protein LEMLEM_LOCUS7457 [Lemmus lemmus]
MKLIYFKNRRRPWSGVNQKSNLLCFPCLASQNPIMLLLLCHLRQPLPLLQAQTLESPSERVCPENQKGKLQRLHRHLQDWRTATSPQTSPGLEDGNVSTDISRTGGQQRLHRHLQDWRTATSPQTSPGLEDGNISTDVYRTGFDPEVELSSQSLLSVGPENLMHPEDSP